jgi:hypothetical protein
LELVGLLPCRPLLLQLLSGLLDPLGLLVSLGLLLHLLGPGEELLLHLPLLLLLLPHVHLLREAQVPDLVRPPLLLFGLDGGLLGLEANQGAPVGAEVGHLLQEEELVLAPVGGKELVLGLLV